MITICGEAAGPASLHSLKPAHILAQEGCKLSPTLEDDTAELVVYRTLAALIVGGLIGAVAVVLYHGSSAPVLSYSPATADVSQVPTVSDARADAHRRENYRSLSTIREIAGLPGEFSQSEALHALAGRSDSVALQALIFEASGVETDALRGLALTILFSRFAELDPESALALAHVDRFANDSSIAETVWRHWAHRDLETALDAAASLPSSARRNAAAQHLYAAFGFMGNEVTDRIQARLGIGPDRATRRSYLYQLADKSPALAIEFINGLDASDARTRNTNWLSQYLALRNPAYALTFADQFAGEREAEMFRNTIVGTMAYDNPLATIERMLGSGNPDPRDFEFRSAVRAVAATNIDAAKQYFEQATRKEVRQMWGGMIAMEFVQEDPLEALRWAREADTSWPQLELSVLRRIAERDPDFAFAEARKSSNVDMRSSVVSMVVSSIAEDDPARAIGYLEQIDNTRERSEASRRLLNTWIRKDPEAAINWVLGQDDRNQRDLVGQIGQSLVDHDVDAAMRILPKLQGSGRDALRQQIAFELAVNRSPAEAQRFIAQFGTEPAYDQMQVALISGIAQTDALAAKQMADLLVEGDARDTAYVQAISHRAQTNPVEASSWLDNIENEATRGTAAGQVAAYWYQSDPGPALGWVRNLSRGSLKDDAILHLSRQWTPDDVALAQLISDIEDDGKRAQAKLRQVHSLIRIDPAEARKLLDESDIPEQQRAEAEKAIRRATFRF